MSTGAEIRVEVDSAPQRLTFSAETPEGFGAYHDLYGSGTTVARIAPSFSASVTAYRLPGLLLFDRTVVGAEHSRDVARVRRDGFDHFNLQVLRSGVMSAGQPGRERRMHPGDIVIFDTSKPQRTLVERADYLSLAIPRKAVEATLPNAGRLHGTVLCDTVAGLLGDFLWSLAQRAPTLGAEIVNASALFIGEMLASAANDVTPAESSKVQSARSATFSRWKAEAFIEAHLGDRRLDPETIAAGICISRSALYRLFMPVDGVARFILERRLDRLSRALSRPGETRTISALAHAFGFAQESHCSRAFKAAFGMSPGQFRASTLADNRRRREAQIAGWGDWWDDLS